MGSPIKVPQANSKSESDQGNRERWAALRNKDLKFYFIFIPIVVFVGGIVFNYSKFLPELDPRVFESLVQVIATFLGFTIVAFFYYLGKIDDRKNDYINSLTNRMRFYGDFISKNEEILKDFLADIAEVKRNKKLHIEENISHTEEKIRRIEEKIRRIEEKIRQTAFVLSQMKADIGSGKSLITEESLKIFEEKADSIRRDLNKIILSYGFGIVLSFMAIFFTTSVITKQIPNYWIWFLLVGVITSVVSTSYWFNHIWQSLQHFSDFLFKKSIEQQLSGLGDNS